MTSSPSFVAIFEDGTQTRMGVFTSLEKLDVGRAVRLSRHAYRQRKKTEPPPMTEGCFERDGETLQSYDAVTLNAIEGRDGGEP
jgi:hypothetical protein